ncbi:MAG: DUF202 domain-containing protein [Nitrospirae bacterium]|nr:DUF202 domain-containing protein [Nitrospirota bacterium]MBF0591913.1 DUF202 domain-containing protein [Nitrospirota bacterium]
MMEHDNERTDDIYGTRPADLTGDLSSNDRNFLAWIRTGVTVFLFGLAVDKFNMFIYNMIYFLRKAVKKQPGLSKLLIGTGRFSSSLTNKEGMYIAFMGLIVCIFSFIQYRIRTRLILKRVFYIDLYHHLMHILITVVVAGMAVLFLLNLSETLP